MKKKSTFCGVVVSKQKKTLPHRFQAGMTWASVLLKGSTAYSMRIFGTSVPS